MIIIGVTYAAYGIIFKAMARLRQKPAPPVANQNNVFCYKEIVFVVDNLTMQDIRRVYGQFSIETIHERRKRNREFVLLIRIGKQNVKIIEK